MFCCAGQIIPILKRAFDKDKLDSISFYIMRLKFKLYFSQELRLSTRRDASKICSRTFECQDIERELNISLA